MVEEDEDEGGKLGLGGRDSALDVRQNMRGMKKGFSLYIIALIDDIIESVKRENSSSVL